VRVLRTSRGCVISSQKVVAAATPEMLSGMMSDSVSKTAKQILKKDGYREFLKGSSLTVAKSTITNTLDLTIYDTCKTYLRTKEGYDFKACAIASGISSLATGIISYPIDLIRNIYQNDVTRGQNQETGFKRISSLLKERVAKNGVRSLFAGFTPYMTRYLIYGPMFWNSFEMFSSLFRSMASC